MICSTLDFAQASFGLVGTLFLATAAIKVSGIARIAGWTLVAGLPIGFFQLAEVGLHTPWTAIIDQWLTPINEIALHITIGIALFAIVRRRLRSQLPRSNQEQNTRLHTLQIAPFKSFFQVCRAPNSEADLHQPIRRLARQWQTFATICSRSRIRTYSPMGIAVRLDRTMPRSPVGSPSVFTTRTASSNLSCCVK